MEHGHTAPQVTAGSHHDPGDFVAEEARIAKAKPNYIGVFIFLGVLTALEVAITSLLPNTIGRIPVLLSITVAKGLLVVLYYMHLKFDNRLYAFFFGAGVFAFAAPMVLAMVFLLSPPQLTSARAGGGGGGGEAPAARPTANPNAGPPLTFNTEAGEFYFKPDAAAANAGQAINVIIKNAGSVEHTFVIASKPKDQDAQPWATNDGKLVAKAGPGGNGRGGFIAPGPGEWIFYCNVPGHAPAGMFGTLTVK